MSEEASETQDIAFIAILVDDEITNVISAEENSGIHMYVSSSPTVLDVTNLTYKPAKGSIWDGQEFTIPSHSVAQHTPPVSQIEGQQEFRTFAYLVGNVCSGTVSINPEYGSRLIAAYSSNPTFVDVTSLASNYAEANGFVGSFFREGQIVTE